MKNISDDEFRKKIDQHFALYRLNLRSPVVRNVAPDQWYRIEVFLVNEVGLFKRSAIEPSGKVVLNVDVLADPNGPDPSMAQLERDPNGHVLTRASTWDGPTSIDNTGIAGCCGSGKGALEFKLTDSASYGPKYLRVYCQQVHDFPQEQPADSIPDDLDDLILPLVIGPVFLHPSDRLLSSATNKPMELWPEDTPMVHATYRWFGTQHRGHLAIHEAWEDGIHGKVWDSALVMVKMIQRMAQHPSYRSYLDGKHVVDLSAGTGLLGMCALRESKCRRVTVTELEEALPLIKSNVALNHQDGDNHDRIQVLPLLWGDHDQAMACGKADLILASDVLYEAEFFESLVASLVDLCAPKGRVYIGYKRRGFDHEEEARFWTLCQAHFQVTLLNDHPDDPDGGLLPVLATKVGVKLYRLVPA